METEKKPDGRKMNGGRGVKKENNPKLKQVSQNDVVETPVNNNQSQTTMVTDKQNTENSETKITETVDTVKQNTNVTPEENKFSAIPETPIIDESKLSDEIPATDQDHTPLKEPVVVEEYRNPYKGQVAENVVAPEAKFEKPNIDAMKSEMFGKSEEKAPNTETPNTETKTASTSNGGSNGTNDALRKTLENPDLKFATPDEKRQGAEQLVDGALGLYSKINELGAWAASINIDKKKEEQLDGKIDLSFQIPIDEDTSISLEEFIVNYNNECKKAISVAPEFIEKVKPVMIRVCEKNGWGLTDEQYLIYMFGRDMLEKAAMVVGMKRSMNASLRMIQKIHIAQNSAHENQNTNSSQKNNNDFTHEHNSYRERATTQDFVNNNPNTDATELVVPEVVGEEKEELSSLKINEVDKNNPELDITKQ